MKPAATILFIFLLLTTGCASSRLMVNYDVSSEPSGSLVEVNGVQMGETPTKITLSTTKRWVGILNAPGGWAYGNEMYRVTVYPPPTAKETLYTQTKVIQPALTPQGGRLFFNLRLESVYPTQPVEIKKK